MEKGSEPLTESEKADLDAIAALKESAAIELKVSFCRPSILFYPFMYLQLCTLFSCYWLE